MSDKKKGPSIERPDLNNISLHNDSQENMFNPNFERTKKPKKKTVNSKNLKRKANPKYVDYSVDLNNPDNGIVFRHS